MTCLLLAGGSGFIGGALRRHWREHGLTVRRLVRGVPRAEDEFAWDPAHGHLDDNALTGCTAVVNLAGENIGGGRWSAARKAALCASRLDTTALLARTIAAGPWRPEVWINASAVGFYGGTGDRLVDEAAPPGRGFLAELCAAWEAATQPAEAAGVRVVHLRLGVVLDRSGGLLQRLVPVYRAGLGGRLGDGRQWQSWVALPDVVGAVECARTERQCTGALNVVAPEPVRQADFATALATALGRRARLPTPGWVVRATLGEMGRELLLAGQRVDPAGLRRCGYRFRVPDLAAALAGTG